MKKVEEKILSSVEKDYLKVQSNTSVTILNKTLNIIEKFNVVELKWHYEPRFGNTVSMFKDGHIIDTIIYDEKIDIFKNEISIDSEFGKIIKGHKVGYKFIFKNELLEILEIKEYNR